MSSAAEGEGWVSSSNTVGVHSYSFQNTRNRFDTEDHPHLMHSVPKTLKDFHLLVRFQNLQVAAVHLIWLLDKTKHISTL